MKAYLHKVFLWLVVYPLIILICIEVAFRIMGYGTFYNEDYKVKSVPQHAYLGDEKLGIQLNPGTYKITLNDKVTFQTMHLESGYRETAFSIKKSPSVVFLGCSFTYGYGVNNEETFASVLQQELPEENVLNAGVIGYGTVQSLIQLREFLEEQKPKLIVLNLSSLHFMRNTLSYRYRSNLKIGYKRSSEKVESLMKTARFPYISDCTLEIKYQPWETMYKNWPLRNWLSSVNGIQLIYDRKTYHNNEVEVTACIIKEMYNLCKENKVKFLVSCIDNSQQTNELKSRLPSSLHWKNIDFDFTSTQLTHLPTDSHPNKEGHLFIAKKLLTEITDLLHE